MLRFLLSKSQIRKIEKRQLEELTLTHNGLTAELYTTPELLCKFFSPEVCRASFSGELQPDASELDYFYIIKHDQKVIGFFRTIDLFFDDIVEVHGSYGYSDMSYLVSYMALSRLYIAHMRRIFPSRRMITIVHNDNKSTLQFVKWLGFERESKDECAPGKRSYILDNKVLDDAYKKLL